MSVVTSALFMAAAAVEDKAFDETKVTPGYEGFIATAVFAAAVILLGFLLVKRIRRSAYRAEVRENIAEELAQQEGDAGKSGSAGAASAGSAGA